MSKWYLKQSEFQGKTEIEILEEETDNLVFFMETKHDNHNKLVEKLNHVVWTHNESIKQ